MNELQNQWPQQHREWEYKIGSGDIGHKLKRDDYVVLLRAKKGQWKWNFYGFNYNSFLKWSQQPIVVRDSAGGSDLKKSGGVWIIQPEPWPIEL